jgi:hypothetical protein
MARHMGNILQFMARHMGNILQFMTRHMGNILQFMARHMGYYDSMLCELVTRVHTPHACVRSPIFHRLSLNMMGTYASPQVAHHTYIHVHALCECGW